MSQSIQALRETRSAAAKEINDLVNDFPKDQTFGDAEKVKYSALVDTIGNLDADIDRHQKVLDIAASEHKVITDRAGKEGISTDEANHKNTLDKAAIAAFMRGGMSNLSEDQRSLMAARTAGVSNAMTIGTGAEGGYTGQNEFAPFLVEAMKAFGGMRQVATVIATDSGNQMDWPTADATAETGEIVGENTAVAVGETTFGTKALTVYKYSSKSIALPFELLQDSQIDIESYIRDLLATRLGRITNDHFTTGTGTGQPTGVITAATVGKTAATGQTTNIKYADLIDLEHSVDPSYRGNPGVGFMFNDLTLAEIKKLTDDQNRPLWLPGIAAGEPDRILNRPYTINQSMAVMAANALSVAFGDFGKYIIRDVMSVQLFRMTDSKYTEKGQVGFLAFMRSGGNLIDVGGAVKTYKNSAT
ncbi:MAG: phage major capsid protein [Candidatus Reddybacter sp.]